MRTDHTNVSVSVMTGQAMAMGGRPPAHHDMRWLLSAGQQCQGTSRTGGGPRAAVMGAAPAAQPKRRSAPLDEAAQEAGSEAAGGERTALELIRQKAQKLSPAGMYTLHPS